MLMAPQERVRYEFITETSSETLECRRTTSHAACPLDVAAVMHKRAALVPSSGSRPHAAQSLPTSRHGYVSLLRREVEEGVNRECA